MNTATSTMNTTRGRVTVRAARLVLSVAMLAMGAALALFAGAGAAAATSPTLGNTHLTGGLSYPFLPTAVAYRSDSTTGCALGYYYGALEGFMDPGLPARTPVTCLPFASDFNANAVATLSKSATTTCPVGYQPERAGDGYASPQFTRCWPFVTEGDPASRPQRLSRCQR